MDFNIPNIQQLNPDELESRILQYVSSIEGMNTGLDVRQGFIHDYVIRLQAVISQAISEQVDAIPLTLNPIPSEEAAAIDSGILDTLVANLGVIRNAAEPSQGQVSVVVDSPSVFILSSATRIISEDGQVYQLPRTYTVRPNELELRTSGDVLLRQLSDVTYAATVPVVATTVGESPYIAAGAELQITGQFVPGLVRVIAATEITGGRSVESNAALLERARRLFPIKSPSTRASFTAYLTDPSRMPTISAVSTLGFGDGEHRRAIAAGPGGNSLVDVLLKPQPLPRVERVRLPGTVTQLEPGQPAIWRIVVDRDILPGFYEITGVVPPDDLHLLETETQYSFDATPVNGGRVPALFDANHARFSRYQTAIITATTASQGLSIGDTRDFDTGLYGYEGIDVAQSFFSSRENQPVSSDVLVRAAIPTEVSIRVELVSYEGEPLPDPSQLATTVSSYVNNLGFAGAIYTSQIVAAIAPQLPTNTKIKQIIASGITRLPDGSQERRRSDTVLRIPEVLAKGLSARSSAFYLEPQNVVITAVKEDTVAAG